MIRKIPFDLLFNYLEAVLVSGAQTSLNYGQVVSKVPKLYEALTEDTTAITVSKFQDRLCHFNFFPHLEQLSTPFAFENHEQLYILSV